MVYSFLYMFEKYRCEKSYLFLLIFIYFNDTYNGTYT